MRGHVPSYALVSPASLSDALGVLAREPGVWKPFAGGTDLMVLLEAGKLSHKGYLNLWNLNELRGTSVTASEVTVGALTTYTEVQATRILQEEFPMLCQAASETGGLAIQNRGTLGGNIVNASPAADSPPALLAYDADLTLISTRGARTLPYRDFHLAYKETALEPDELVHSVTISRNYKRYKTYIRKVGPRNAQAISKVAIAVLARMNKGRIEDIRIGAASVREYPARLTATEKSLTGETITPESIAAARATILTEVRPIDDIRSTAKYRATVAANLLEEFLLTL